MKLSYMYLVFIIVLALCGFIYYRYKISEAKKLQGLQKENENKPVYKFANKKYKRFRDEAIRNQRINSPISDLAFCDIIKSGSSCLEDESFKIANKECEEPYVC